MTKLLFASVLLAALLRRHAGLDVIPAAVLAAATAGLVRTALDQRSGGSRSVPPLARRHRARAG